MHWDIYDNILKVQIFYVASMQNTKLQDYTKT